MPHRIYWLRIGLLLGLAVLTIRLIHLQVLRGAHYRQLAERNRLRLVPEQAPRGLILDREGRVLATNHTAFRVALVPQDLEQFPQLIMHVSQTVGRSPDSLRQAFTRERSLAFVPATIVRRIPKEVALHLEEERWRWPGLLVDPETIRHYPRGESAAHLLGYLSQPTPEELPRLKQYGVRPQYLVGRTGLERLLNDQLLGRPGGLMVEVNHRARQVRVLGRKSPEPGTAVTLTIEAPLQSLIEETFAGQAGAAVVLNPETGEVLAMVSQPAFSPEAFANLENKTIVQLLDDPRTPVVNRATMGAYPPGSILKLITASAALEHHLITPQTIVHCPGSMRIGNRVFHCWQRDGHGPMNLSDALKQSCNVYFMHVARQVRTSHLKSALSQMGFGHQPTWPLGSQAGHLPDRRLSEGEIALLGIGQGEISVTPLQAAVMAAAFANRGWLVDPWVVKRIGDQAAEPQRPRRRLGWSAATLDPVIDGMKAVVQQPDGTGHRAFNTLISVAGKTGTAQTHQLDQTHGWFVGFCPVDTPKVAMAILAEFGGSGGDLPAEIARTICEYVATAQTL